MGEPITRAEVDKLIRDAIAAERKNLKRQFKHMLDEFAGQFRTATTGDLERIMLTWTGEIPELNRALAELRRLQGAPLDKPLPPPPHAH
jgi:hypothetical protein